MHVMAICVSDEGLGNDVMLQHSPAFGVCGDNIEQHHAHPEHCSTFVSLFLNRKAIYSSNRIMMSMLLNIFRKILDFFTGRHNHL